MIYIFSLILSFNLSFADQSTIYFGKEINTCLDQETLWNQLDISLTDSENSDLWPNRSSTVAGSGIEEDSVIDVTYKSPITSSTYSYSISDVTSPITFTYTAIAANHPFEGGAKITIEDQGNYRVLKWEGEYDTPESAWLSRRFFKIYSSTFFKRLEKRIKKLENNKYIFIKDMGCLEVLLLN